MDGSNGRASHALEAIQVRPRLCGLLLIKFYLSLNTLQRGEAGVEAGIIYKAKPC